MSNDYACLSESTSSGLDEAVILARKWSVDRYPAGQVRKLLNASVEAVSALEQAQSCFRSLIATLECNCDPALETANHLLNTIELLDTAPFGLLHLRHPVFEIEGTSATILAAKGEAQTITTNENVLQRDFDLSLCDAESSSESLTQLKTRLHRAPREKDEITWTAVRAIRKLYMKPTGQRYKNGGEMLWSCPRLVERYNLLFGTVWSIVNSKIWQE